MKPIHKFIGFMLAGIVFVIIAQAIGKQAAIRKTSVMAQEAKMPDGVFGVKFLDNLSTLQRIRPGVARINSQWTELTEWQGIPVRAFYIFDEKELHLIMVVLNLLIQGDINSFKTVNVILTTQYGALSPPMPQSDFFLYAERRAGGVALFHGLMQTTDGKILHQVAFYKRKQEAEMHRGSEPQRENLPISPTEYAPVPPQGPSKPQQPGASILRVIKIETPEEHHRRMNGK